jgi:hypothetical protein
MKPQHDTLRELAKIGALARLAQIHDEVAFIQQEFPGITLDPDGAAPLITPTLEKKPRRRGRPPKALNATTAPEPESKRKLTRKQRDAIRKAQKMRWARWRAQNGRS